MKRELAIRIVLVPLAVVVCHCFQWGLFRFGTSSAVMMLSGLLGLPMARISSDTITANGETFRFVVSCTYIDVFCGAIPLLWRTSGGWGLNIARLAMVWGCLMIFNVVRLSVSHILYATGVPWVFAHETISGAAYFAVFLWIVRSMSSHKQFFQKRN